MSKEVLNKQVGEWRKEIARLKDLIAHATGTEAAANKATEEGERMRDEYKLPALPLTKSQYGFDHTLSFCASDMYEYARQAIAADRTSRQVVEKTTNEVELPVCVECNGTGEADSGGVHPWGEPAMITCGCRDRASRQVANKAEVDLSGLPRFGWTEAYIGDTSELVEDAEGTYVKFSDVRALLATPPATTGGANATPTGCADAPHSGASTAPHEIAKALGLYEPVSMLCAVKAIESLRTPVGASTAFMPTVLTDERIIEDARDWGLLDIQDGGRVDRSTLIGFVREIKSAGAASFAAQAGNVLSNTSSVPSAVAVPEQSIFTEEDHRMLHSVAGYMRRSESPRCSADLISLAERLRNARQVAPSPAKESK